MKCLYLILLLFSLTFIGCKSSKNLNTIKKENIVELVQKEDSTKVVKQDESIKKSSTEKSEEKEKEQIESESKNKADSIIIIEENGKTITKIYNPNQTLSKKKTRERDIKRELINDLEHNKKLMDSVKAIKEKIITDKQLDEQTKLQESSETKSIISDKLILIGIILAVCLLEIFSKGTLTKLLIKIVTYLRKGWQYVTTALFS